MPGIPVIRAQEYNDCVRDYLTHPKLSAVDKQALSKNLLKAFCLLNGGN